jgi:hypothetical protein
MTGLTALKILELGKGSPLLQDPQVQPLRDVGVLVQ